jgi:hypothetical protein
MAMPSLERRQSRSDDLQEALHLQLASVCRRAGSRVAVLAGEDGLAIAHAGDSDLCEELAAVLPLVAQRRGIPPEVLTGAGALHVHPLRYAGQRLYLATCSENDVVEVPSSAIDGFLAAAGEGVARILGAA